MCVIDIIMNQFKIYLEYVNYFIVLEKNVSTGLPKYPKTAIFESKENRILDRMLQNQLIMSALGHLLYTFLLTTFICRIENSATGCFLLNTVNEIFKASIDRMWQNTSDTICIFQILTYLMITHILYL